MVEFEASQDSSLLSFDLTIVHLITCFPCVILLLRTVEKCQER